MNPSQKNDTSECPDHDDQALEFWEARRADAQKNKTWVSMLYSERDLKFEVGGAETTWRIVSTIVDRWDERNEWPYTARGVLECTRIDEGCEEENAILKVYIQIPAREEEYGEADPDPDPPIYVQPEIKALKMMSPMGKEAPGPSLLAARCSQQSEDMWVPRGFLCMLLMEKLPGITLKWKDYWSWSEIEQNEVCDAFAVTYRKLQQLKIRHWDPALRNILWDKKNQKCYIVDYEGATFPHEMSNRVDSFHFQAWDLKRVIVGRYDDGEPIYG